MKTTVIFVFFIMAAISGLKAQTRIKNEEVPRPFRHEIHTAYPQVKNFQWYKTEKGYLVRFNANGKEQQEIFPKKSKTEIPTDLKAIIRQNEGDINITSVTSQKSKEYGTIYKLETDNKILFYTKDGKKVLTLCK